MNQLAIGQNGPTMTSREIADLVESRHDSVKRTIERLVDGMLIASPPMVDGQKSANNQVERVYVVGKRDSYVIVAQLSPAFTARLVDRWQELEEITATPPRALTVGEMFLVNAHAMVAIEQKQQEQATQLAEQADAIKRIESAQVAASGGPQSFTALGYSVIRHLHLSSIELNKLGRRASAISKKLGITVDKVNDVRFGLVNAYHVTALDAALEEMMK